MSDPGGAAAAGPLAAIRVLEFGGFLPVPLAGQTLGDLGADVIKVEPPAGDPARALAAQLFWPANRNKRSVVLDLKQPDQRAACRRLLATADVVLEGYRPGVAGRLGIDPDETRSAQPALIYCSISGYGQRGSAADDPGHDLNYVAAGGALEFGGHWGEEPRRMGIPVSDLLGALHAVQAVLAALHDRARTGAGARLDVAMTDAVLAAASLRGGRDQELTAAEAAHVLPTNDVFTTADGRDVAVGVLEQHFWDRLRTALGEADPVVLEERFDTEDGRREDGDLLKAALQRAFATKSLDDWLHELRPLDVPVSPVRTLREAVKEVGRPRGLIHTLGDEQFVGLPVLRDRRPMGAIRRGTPGLGEHTSEVLEHGSHRRG